MRIHVEPEHLAAEGARIDAAADAADSGIERVATRVAEVDAEDLPVTPHNIVVMLRPDGRVFIEVYSRPVQGTWTLNGVPDVIPGIDDAERLGKAILDALERSTWRVIANPDPRNNPVTREVLKWAGARNWKQYTRGSKAVSVYARYAVAPPTSVDISPGARERSGAFVPIRDAHREGVRFQSAEELGRLVQEAMKVARA